MSNSKTKKHLKLLMVIGLLALVGGSAGTFASFSAETTNSGNTFATGSLLLSNIANGGTACLSDAKSGNVNHECNAFIKVTNQEPGSDIAEGTVTVKNTGTLNATTLSLFAPKEEPKGCVDTYVGGAGPLGTGQINKDESEKALCEAVVMSVEEIAQTQAKVGKETETEATAYHYCWSGLGHGGFHCTTTKGTLNEGGGETISSFDTAYDAEKALDLRPLDAEGKVESTVERPELAKEVGSREFKVRLYLPKTEASQNNLQDLVSTLALTWHINQ